jgi:O-antigen/teichoic acid export membrane protein
MSCDGPRTSATPVATGCALPSSDTGPGGKERGLPAARSLRGNCSWALAGYAVYGVCQWGMLLVLARLGSPELVGAFVFALAVTAPIMLLCNLGLGFLLATDASAEYHFGHYLGLRLLTTACGLAAVLALGLTVFRATAGVILLVGLAKAFESVSEICHGCLQRHERIDRVARSMILRSFLTLGCFAGVLAATGSLPLALAALASVWLAVLIGYDLVSVARTAGPVLRPCWDLPMLGRLAWLAAPLAFATTVNCVSLNVPRYFIEPWLGTRSLGLYAAAASLMEIGNLGVRALAQAANPRLAVYHASGDRSAFRALLFRLAGLAAAGGLVGIVLALALGRQVLTFLYTAEYGEQQDVLVWLAVAAAIGYVCSFLDSAMVASRRLNVQAPLFGGLLLLKAAACWAFIGRYGLVGAAWANVLTALVQGVCASLVVANAVGRSTPGPKVH